MARAHDSYS